MDALYEQHILHSLAIAKFIQFQKGTTVLDIGTGGGFPGIPLAIMFPEVSFTLTDSIQKKIKVVADIAHQLGLENVSPKAVRSETVKQKFDFVVTRAVAPVNELWKWCGQKFSAHSKHAIANGLICLKGGDLSAELAQAGRPHQLIPLNKYFVQPFFETKSIVYLPA
ncbi:MAG: hypothetical protein RIQ89_1795 [Bacteroidota bacterium]